MMSTPLEGLRVLDLSREIPGAFATRMLADAGANVVKVEAPSGDPLRRMKTSAVLMGSEPLAPGEDGAASQRQELQSAEEHKGSSVAHQHKL